MRLYSPTRLREGIGALTADPLPPELGPQLPERTPVAARIWWPRLWQHELRTAAASGTPLSAVGVRTAPMDRALASREWADIARRIATVSGWQHAPWVAVRTGIQSLVMVAGSGQRPSPTELHRLATVLHQRFGLAAPSDGPGPTAPDTGSPAMQPGRDVAVGAPCASSTPAMTGGGG